MFNVDDPEVPWHRVINGRGEISVGGALHRPDLQRELLIREGVALDGTGRIDLQRYGWMPAAREFRRLVPAALLAGRGRGFEAVVSAGRPARRPRRRGKRT